MWVPGQRLQIESANGCKLTLARDDGSDKTRHIGESLHPPMGDVTQNIAQLRQRKIEGIQGK